MTTFDQFVVTDGSVIVGPADGSEPVTLDAAITERTDHIAGWERLVADWLEAGDGSVSLGADGKGKLSRDRVLSATVSSPVVTAVDRRSAEAVLAFLAREGVVEVDGDSITVLWPFDEAAETRAAAYNNWAAAFSVLIERLEVLKSRLWAVWTTAGDDGTLNITASVDTTAVGQRLERLSVARDVFAERRDDLRRVGAGADTFPEGFVEVSDQYTTVVRWAFEELPTETDLATTADQAVVKNTEDVVEQITDFVSSLSSTFEPADKMEDESLDDFLDDVAVEQSEINKIDDVSDTK